MNELRPQPKQVQFLSSPADIAVFGGAAGGGKSWALLAEPCRHISNKRFGAVLFRRTTPELLNEGGLWDEAGRIYPFLGLGATPNANNYYFKFSSGAKISFRHLQFEDDVYAWRSSQIPLIEFDQLETFTENQFFYMLTRNRSTCGVKPYVRAACNPQPGWLCDFEPIKHGFLEWWIGDDGYALPERSGVIRWMIRRDNEILWADSYDESVKLYGVLNLPKDDPKQVHPLSVTFILSTIFDNPILLEKDPLYLAKLMAEDFVTRERLLGDPARGGNWRVKPEAGKIFNRDWFSVISEEELPAFPYFEVRFWDLAATKKELNKKDPDFTAGIKMRYYPHNHLYIIMDCVAKQIAPADADNLMYKTAEADGHHCRVRWEEEGGASGKRDSYHIVTMLRGYDAEGVPPHGEKTVRAKELASQSKAGNVKLFYNPFWNNLWLNHMHGQPDMTHDDIMDASSGSFNELTAKKKVVGTWGSR
jgi:predicted phage terminase large subunit-like protein